MDQQNRPHSRQKTTGTGSAGVGRGRQVNTGSRPVGSGGRTPSAPGNPGERSTSGRQTRSGLSFFPMRRASGVRLNLKTVLILGALLIVALLLFSMCGGLSSLGEGGYSGSQSDPYGGFSGTSSYPSYSGSTQSSQQNESHADLTVSELARDKRVTPLGNGQDTVTVMVYLCGTDLESKGGMATSDLQEMLRAAHSDKVRVIIETGGCSGWHISGISNSVNQIYRLTDDGLSRLVDDFGTLPMTEPKNLTGFIRYCKDNYPADRNILILWDHGGGSLSGYGYDETHSGSSSMTLSMLDSALSAADCTFDWIGFDACLMATLETSLVCEKYADYMIASEETEPGTGWNYTGWLSALSENSSLSTLETAEILIDDFVSASTASSPSAKVTLSLTDLAELHGTVPDAFRGFAASANELIRSGDYQTVSDARAGVRQFAQSSKLNQIDLADFADRLGTDEAKVLAEALRGCVKYNRSTISRCSGISIFFPYETTKSVGTAVRSYEALGIDGEYTKCIQSFASLEYGGQIAASATQTSPSSSSESTDLLSYLLGSYASSGSSTSPVSVLTNSFAGSGSSAAGYSLDPSALLSLLGGFSGRSMPTGYEWVDTELIADQAASIVGQYLDPARITASRKDGKNVLSLTEDEWALIQTVELNVFAEDGGDFLDLGLDNTFDWYGDDLLLEYDGTWLTLNGNVCAYYLVSDTQQGDGSWVTVGRIPALLNKQLVNLQVVFDGAHPEGTVTGAYPLYDGGVDVIAKGDIAVQPGDSIELLCDCYRKDGSYSASYTLGTSFTVPESGLTLRNLRLEAEGLDVTYRLTDLYGNHYWISVPQ